MLKFLCTHKSTSVRASSWFDITDWLDHLSISFTEDEILADLHSGRGVE